VTTIVDVRLVPARLARSDRGFVAVVALTFATSAGGSAVIPILPAIRGAFGLSGLQTGALLSAETLVMLATAVPVGLVAGRVGAHRLLGACAVLLPVSMLGQALAGGLASLLLARGLFGLCFGILWTVGPAVAAGGGRGVGGTGRLMAASGAGWLVGPALSGAAADAFGYRMPFFAIAVLTVPLALAVVLGLDRAPTEVAPSGRLRDAMALTRRDRSIAGVTVTSALLGVVTGVSGLIAPLGIVVALSAVVWICAGALSSRVPAVRIDARLVGAAVAALGLTWLIPVFSLSTLAIVGFLLVSAAFRSLLGALIFIIPVRLAVASEAHAAPVIGVMNAAWAAMALAAPLAAGIVVGGADVRWAFFCTAVVGLGVAAWILVPRPRVPAAPQPA
jgi:MFS family permease